MGEEKENKRERYENINIECPLMEKKWGGDIHSVGLFNFPFALDLHICFCLFLYSCWDGDNGTGLQLAMCPNYRGISVLIMGPRDDH